MALLRRYPMKVFPRAASHSFEFGFNAADGRRVLGNRHD